jgi:hypothetical protein
MDGVLVRTAHKILLGLLGGSSGRANKTPSATAWEEIRSLGDVLLLDALPNGTLLGRSATSTQNIAYSTDEGLNWTDVLYQRPVNYYFPSPIYTGRVMGDNSFVVWLYSGAIYRSPSPLTADFALVGTVENNPGKSPLNPYATFVSGQYAMYNEYGAEPANHAYLSSDYGANWAKVFTLPADHTPAEQHHLHNVAYDPYQSLLWVCSGDDTNRMIYYSSDNGSNWTQLGAFETMASAGNMIQIIPLPECILFTTDAAPSGAYSLVRRADRNYVVSSFTLVKTVSAGGAVGARPANVSGADACTYFSFQFYSSALSNTLSHIYATRNGVEFFDIATPTYTPTGSGTFGVECLCGPCANGYIYGQHWQGAAKYLFRFAVPAWS